MATLLRESLQQLQDNATMELRAREDRAKKVLQEQNINIEQLHIQRDKAVTQKQQVEKLVVEACSSAPDLEIGAELPIETRICTFSTGFRQAKEEVARI